MARSSLVSCALGLVCVSLVGWLPACSGEVITGPTGGEGGAGEGGAAPGGDGGAETTTVLSSGSTSIPVDPDCSPSCEENTVCVSGQCEPIVEVDLTPSRVRFVQVDGSTGESGSVAACQRPAGASDVTQVLAVEGVCRLVESPFPGGGEPPGFTSVLATAPSFGTAQLEQADPAFCWVADVGVTPSYLMGESVHFEAKMGANGVGFGIDAPSPPPLVLQAGDLKKGQPFQISWQTPGAPPSLLVLQLDSDVQIECQPTEGTSLVVPASLTALLDTADPYLLVAGVVRATPNVLELSPTYRASAAGARIEWHLREYDATP